METMHQHLTIYGDAAILLGTDIRTISGLVKKLGIKPKRHPLNRLAKGLDRDDMALLHRALNPEPIAASA